MKQYIVATTLTEVKLLEILKKSDKSVKLFEIDKIEELALELLGTLRLSIETKTEDIVRNEIFKHDNRNWGIN